MSCLNRNLKKKLRLGAFVFTFLAILLTMGSNVQLGRNTFKNIFTRQLGRGIHELFQNPSKYRSWKIREKTVLDTKWFCLERGDNGFEELKKIMLRNYHKTREGDALSYPVKAIMALQWWSSGEGDEENPIFHQIKIWFVPETPENKEVPLKKNKENFKLTSKNRKNWHLITTQKELTKNLDTFFTNWITSWACFFLFIAIALDVKAWKIEGNN